MATSGDPGDPLLCTPPPFTEQTTRPPATCSSALAALFLAFALALGHLCLELIGQSSVERGIRIHGLFSLLASSISKVWVLDRLDLVFLLRFVRRVEVDGINTSIVRERHGW